jgi:dTDP-4-dehydrorhamnose reductase
LDVKILQDIAQPIPEITSPDQPLQLWGGVECTVNRVGDEYIEQLARSGHLSRLSDYELFAALGIRVLRQPIVWEKVAPESLATADWSWPEAAIEKLQQLGMTPIAGLVHHGSGPSHTSLIDPQFPDKLAEYAEAVSTRYPWIEWYTPVNEPLTTARFSGLYGHWYPHGRDDSTFLRALVNECRATILAMQAIRKVNAKARLVQTDDLGKTFSTPRMAYQAELENERHWLSFDLLCGRVHKNHPLWAYLIASGIRDSELEWLQENRCPPDVLGINHYLSGERYLDEHLERYPEYAHGGNGRDRYADVLAARVRLEGMAGTEVLLKEAWERYRIPIAITECHNGCSREEQLRWFLEVWRGAERVKQDGATVLAVTAWSLLGAFDWNHLVTRNNGHYESGVFDLRSPQPRPTAIASLIKNLGSGHEPDHPLLEVPGWWKRPERFIYGISLHDSGEMNRQCEQRPKLATVYPAVRPVLITGGRGTLGYAFARICEARGIPNHVLSRAELDIANRDSIHRALFELQPWAIINTAGYVRVDDAEVDCERCFRENTLGPELLGSECADRDIQLLTFSSDLVFNGLNSRPYSEGHEVDPLNQYGLSKAEAERRVLNRMPAALVVRTSAFFGPWDQYNFIYAALRSLAASREFRAAEDVFISPTYVPDLVNASLDLLIDRESGIWHLANPGEVSWATLAHKAAQLASISTRSLQPCSMTELNLAARRPTYSVLGSARGLMMPPFEDALQRYTHEREVRWEPEELAA